MGLAIADLSDQDDDVLSEEEIDELSILPIPRWHVTLCSDDRVHAFILIGRRLHSAICGARVVRSPNATYAAGEIACERCLKRVGGGADRWERVVRKSARRAGKR